MEDSISFLSLLFHNFPRAGKVVANIHELMTINAQKLKWSALVIIENIRE